MISERYWDSSAFLGWLNKRPDRYDACDQILADAEAGKLRIVCSRTGGCCLKGRFLFDRLVSIR